MSTVLSICLAPSRMTSWFYLNDGAEVHGLQWTSAAREPAIHAYGHLSGILKTVSGVPFSENEICAYDAMMLYVEVEHLAHAKTTLR